MLSFVLLGLMVVAGSARGQSPPDKSGVKGSAISLPSGAGSIEGLGESFEQQLNTGGSSYGVAISLPPGRAGLTPSVRVGYHSFAGNGVAGIGWSLDFMSLKRQTDKGFPEYNESDNFIFEGEELVPLNNAEQDWRCENERNFSRLRRIDGDGDGILDAWEVTERNGTRHTLGRFRGQNGAWSVVEHPEKSAAMPFDRTYSWMIDSTTDLHGNQINYEYTQGPGVLYPSRITYGHFQGNVHEVLFTYEARPDVLDDYRPTFSATLDRRLSRVEVRSQGQLVRAYNFQYDYVEGDLTPDVAARQSTYLDLGVTLLKRVVQVDRSGNDANFLPPLIFLYSGLDLTRAQLRGFSTPPELDLADPDGRVQLADLDGDALPDLFATTAEGVGTVQRVALNRGESLLTGQPLLSFDPARLVLGSSPVDLARPNTVVHDPKGKGLVDMSSLEDDGLNKRLETFGNRARLDLVDENRLGFTQDDFQATILENPPAFVTYSSAATRQMDSNFDKRGDFVNLEPSFGSMLVNSFYINRHGQWVSGQSTLPPSYPIANTFNLPDGTPNPCVHLADMNGDRMLDLVCLDPQPGGAGLRLQVNYWPLCGLGRYAEQRSVPAAEGDLFEIGNADLRDVFIDDVTGDGLADIVVLDGSGPQTVLSLRVNIAGQRWSQPFTKTGLPRYAPRDAVAPTIVRLADLNANGSLDFLFRNTAVQNTWEYLELLPDGAPSLITGIDNSIGQRTTIVYGAAATDEQLARESGHPWRTYAPFALAVVRQIRVTSGQDLNGDGREDTAVSEFRYRDPYYDGYEREFRGFAFAQRVDYGDDFLFDPVTGLMGVSSGWDAARTPTGQVSGPSLVTRYRFHTGSADQQDNDDYGGTPPASRLVDEFTEVGGHEEEPLKGLQWVEEKVDPVVLHAALDATFDAGCEAASMATTTEGRGKLTPDDYVYTRSFQDWVVRRLYRPAEALPYFADQDADGVLEDYRDAPLAPVPAGRFAGQGITVALGDGRSVSFPYASNAVTEVREANGLLSDALGYPVAPMVRTVQSVDFDDYGNQTILRDFGVEGGGYDDERFTMTSYAHGGNALSLWVIDKPFTIDVTDENGAFVSREANFYDGTPLVGLSGMIEDRALLSRTLAYVDDDNFIEETRTGYDAFGNKTEMRDPVGNRRLVAYDPVFQTYPISETIVVGEGSSDLVVTAGYDLGFGVVTNAIDFNGHQTTYHYDSFARLVKIARPGDTADLPTQTFEYQPVDPVRGKAFVYNAAGDLTVLPVELGSLSRVTTRQREIAGQAGEFITASYTDGSGKEIASVEEGQVAGTWIVKQATSFNLRLNAQSEWLPFQVSSANLPQFTQLWPAGRPPATDGVNPSVVANDHYYDPVGRLIRTVHAPETWDGPRRATAAQHLPLRKRLFDQEDLLAGSPHFGTPHEQFMDGLERLIAVEEVVKLTDTGEAGPLAHWRTEYEYDLNDQLVSVRDSQGNVKTLVVDGLKRVTSVNDPDHGHMSFDYDDASNLRETVDAKGQRIVYTYDGVNRIKTEDYQDGGPAIDVEYHYDAGQPGLDLGHGATGSAANTKGQLAWVRDPSGETHFSYDARGRTEWEVKRLPDAGHGHLVSYQTRFHYDSADRIQRLTYPDGDEIHQAYNSRSLLSRIFGSTLGDVVGTIGYQPSGQIAGIRYGNQVGSSYVFDPRLRMTHLRTTNGTTRLIDFSYTFDGVSNLERIDDGRDLAGQPAGTDRFNTQVYSYDNLYRLTGAQYPSLGSPAISHIDYRYDRIGNMLNQTSDMVHEENGLPLANVGTMDAGGPAGSSNRQGRQAGEPPGPHALTRITGSGGPREYGYDDNGNMITADGMTNSWDFKDRLVRVESTNMVAVYAYDFLDRRATKTVHWKNPGPGQGNQASALDPAWRTTTTHYVNRYFEVREHDAVVKYVWNDQTRVARVTARLGGTEQIQTVRLHEGWNLVCLRVGGSFSVLDPANHPEIGACTYWSGGETDNGYAEVTAATVLPPGANLWVYARQATTVVLTGTPATPLLPELAGGNQYYGNLLAEPIRLPSVFSDDAWVASFNPAAQAWQHRFSSTDGLAALQDQLVWLRPGEGAWVKTGASTLVTNHAALQIQYYHQDHLDSTSVATDADGALVEEAAYYPFGKVRHSYAPRSTRVPYHFTQKEQDQETGIHYFEARYLAGRLGRFTSVDPKYSKNNTFTEEERGEFLGNPQKLNLYAYTLNNPLKYLDPDGEDISTPLTGRTVSQKRANGPAVVTLNNGVKVTVKQDAKVRRLRSHGETSIKFSARPNKSKTAVNISISIQTKYRRGVNPDATSAYGRGTTAHDKRHGNTSLKFHEGSHGEGFLDYLESNPLPELDTSMPFRKAWTKFRRELGEYNRDMNKESTDNVDCVGAKGSMCP